MTSTGAHKSSGMLIKDNLVPVITPKLPTGEVDVQGIENLVKFHEGLGTRALFSVGGLGRFHELTDEQRIEAGKAFIRASKKLETPLVIFTGVTSETAENTLSNMKKMMELGSDVLFFAPLFFLKPDDIPDFVKKAREAIGPDMPLLLYNNPGFTRQEGIKNIDPEILRSCSGYYSAIKDSSCDAELYEKYSTIDCALYTGNEPTLVEAVKKRRSRGSVGGIGNVTGTAAKLARELAANVDDEEDELKIAELTARFNSEVASLNKILTAHPDVGAGDMMSAIYHYCLGEAGIVQPQAELIKWLTDADKEFLKTTGFIPEHHKDTTTGSKNGGESPVKRKADEVDNGAADDTNAKKQKEGN